MKVKLTVEFEVETLEDVDDPTEFDERIAKSAASEAAYQNLCLTEGGVSVADEVKVWVDGFGYCLVKVGEEHE